jgi:1-aminocyclopropane-1-carboxylate deaminase
MIKIVDPYAPIEELNYSLYKHYGVRVCIKREDLSHPYISGNKWRKLKYHLLAAQAQEKQHLQTYGGPYSNHLLATAASGAKYGFKTKGIVRGEPVSNPILKLCSLFGMELTFVDREHYKTLVQEALQENSNTTSYIIPEGGGGALGEKGVSELVQPWEYQHVFTSVGTGSTMRGLLQGMQAANNLGIVQGVVVLKGAEAMAQEFINFPAHSYQLHFNYHEGGYAKTNAALMQFIKDFASETGVLLDQVYEAKMIKALNDLIVKGSIKSGQKVLALHNGGLSGLLSQLY